MVKNTKSRIFVLLFVCSIISFSLFYIAKNDAPIISPVFSKKKLIEYYIRKEDNDFSKFYDNSFVQRSVNRTYSLLNEVPGDIVVIYKMFKNNDSNFSMTLVIVYKDNNVYKSRTIRNSNDKLTVTEKLSKFKQFSFYGVCDDQYFTVKPFGAHHLPSSYSYFMYSQNHAYYLNIIISNYGKSLNDIKTNCSKYNIGEYIDMIEAATE